VLKARLIAAAVIASLVVGAAWHYRHVLAKNARLTAQIIQLMEINTTLEAQVEAERRAAEIAIQERRAAQRTLDALRAGREADTDPEYLEWKAQRIPPSERARICAALPEARGCASE
jgi:hypothetical protein